ncbi:hypothetical protein ADICEAN_03487 [Cesiribacter andamanensis AMV16]|uniref:Uncharacterized protein n=1 Tax=Cesiribacter andamanensis AMV16 TaxID=1279009 RepID=M7NSE7_9BACT|nr:hypothetical protein ADICEAN_03487 [Cesiribacter andamanensis AMV16]
MVAQQRAGSMHQNGGTFLPGIGKGLLHPGIGLGKIRPIQAHALQARKAGSVVVGAHDAHFGAGSRNAPVIVLHQVHNG